MKKIYGYELIMDLFECDKEIITSQQKLQEYVDQLCKLIKMKKFGETILAYFGEKKLYTKGFSLIQLIETSSIVGHFSDIWCTGYINIFSCQKFDPQLTRKFTRQFFKAKRMRSRFIKR